MADAYLFFSILFPSYLCVRTVFERKTKIQQKKQQKNPKKIKNKKQKTKTPKQNQKIWPQYLL